MIGSLHGFKNWIRTCEKVFVLARQNKFTSYILAMNLKNSSLCLGDMKNWRLEVKNPKSYKLVVSQFGLEKSQSTNW